MCIAGIALSYRFSLSLIILSLAAASAAAEPNFEVQIDGGKIRGASADGVLAFKGIPFAQPPVGELRWKPPQPVKAWEGVRDATQFAPDPVQLKSGMATPEKMSEDCLYLNVYRPADAQPGKPLAVMVWIYGGALAHGGSSIYPGEGLAKQGIIVVTINYRLGRFGFFAHPALAHETPDAPRGNYGYMDQIAALKWVQRNIAAFGGDARNVTIAGESAGGGSVLVLLTSPLARGLFQRAILESPGIPSPRAAATPMSTLVAAEQTALDFARSEGIEGNDASALQKLRALPAEKIAAGAGNPAVVEAIFGGPKVLGVANSIIDGKLVPEAPEVALRAGRQAPVPVLVGANNLDLAESTAKTKDQLFAIFGSLEAKARALYDPNGDAPLKDLIQQVIADEVMVEPPRFMAESVTASGEPAYLYRFSYVPVFERRSVTGATHGSEIPFAFDVVSAIFKDKAAPADVEMGKTMSAYWVAFVKTGDPNGSGRPAWTRYAPRDAKVLNFTDHGIIDDADPLKARLDLWQEVWSQGR